MKKLISIISAAAVITAIGAATVLHSKADIKIETADFAVTSDRTKTPSAYCRNSDGSPVDPNISSSENFCISQYANGNMSFLSYDSIPAYCIGNHLQNAPVSLTQVSKCTDIPYDSDEYGAIFRIASAGASTGTTEFGLNFEDLYYVTQCAVRGYLYNIQPESLAFYDSDGNLCESMTNEFIRISSAAYEPSIPEYYTLETDETYAEETQIIFNNRSYQRYGPYWVYSPDTDLSEYSVSADDNERFFVSDNGNGTPDSDIENLPAEIPFYVFIESSYQEEVDISVHSEISRQKYEPTVYLTNNESYQNIFQIKISDIDETLSAELKLQNTDSVGEIMINKKFLADDLFISDNDLISQPRFSIKNSDGLYINGIQTSEKIIFDSFSTEPVLFALNPDSTLYVSGLPVGEYCVCEMTGAEGYTAQEPEVYITNTYELNTCDVINVSETTTPVTTTTPEVTTTPYITFSLTESTTYLTEITTEYITETTSETTSEISTTSETTVETLITSSEETTATHKITPSRPSNPHTPSSPKTGESSSVYIIMTTLIISAFIMIKSSVKS